MAADTGPIGGNLSHEFIIVAETGESKIYTDKRIFGVDYSKTKIEKESLSKLRNIYDQFYAVTDEKFNKNEFENKISEENRIITKGIEVGHIFYFGEKYSKSMNASVDKNGKKEFVKMGSYGIGVSRLVAAVIEAKYDEKKEFMNWPINIAPYHCVIMPLISKNDRSNFDKAINIQTYLNNKNIDIIIDDTEESISAKMKKFNLIGVPFQIIIGKNSSDNKYELKKIGEETTVMTIEKIADILIKEINN